MTKDQYICRRAANAILSEIGPYQISSDALQTVNQILDQLLALLLENTQSIQLTLVKSRILGLLPHGLGKNALVEAELEAKTYCETHNTHYQLYDESMNEPIPFPLDQPWTFLRYLCVQHSTLTEKLPNSPDGNNDDSGFQGIVFSPVVIVYFTAILEHIAEYILTIIAITAERQDTKYIRIKEVYSALVNDEQVGGLFKQTDLKSKLEKRISSYQAPQHHSYKPTNLLLPSPSPAGSLQNQTSVAGYVGCQASDLYYDCDQGDDFYAGSPSSSHSPTSSSIKSGQSLSDYRPISVLSNVTSSSNRSSSSSKRSFRFFRKKVKRSSTPTTVHHSYEHHRTKSPPPPAHTPLQPPSSVQVHDSNTPALDFEDLMRSGNTIKVSLTPNRLRSIEVKSSSTYPHQQQKPKKVGLFDKSALSSPSTPISSPTLSHPTPLRVFPPNGTPFENPRAAPKPPITCYQPKSFETPPLTPDSSIASRLSTTRSPSPSFEEDQQPSPQQLRAATSNTRYTKQAMLTPLQLAGQLTQERQCHRKQGSVDTLSTDVCAMDLPSPPSTMDRHPSATVFGNHRSVEGENQVISNSKIIYNRPSSMVAKRAAFGMARPASCYESFAMTIGQQHQRHQFRNVYTTTFDSRPTSSPQQQFYIRSRSSSPSIPPSPSAPIIAEAVPASVRTMRRSITRTSSPAIVEEEENEDEVHGGINYKMRRMNQPTMIIKAALDACTNGTAATTTNGLSWQSIDTPISSRDTIATMVNSSMQTDPLPDLPPLDSLLILAQTKHQVSPRRSTSISIPTLIVTADDHQQLVDNQHSMTTRSIGSEEQSFNDNDNDKDGDDDDDEEWFLEDEDWEDDAQNQDSLMAEWLLGET